MEPFWLQVDESELRPGDYLPSCSIPVFGPAFTVGNEPHEIRTDQGDLIIVTQSCDLEQRKVRLVAGCPIFTLAESEAVNPAFARKGRWNEVLKGRIEGLHLLASPTAPEENRQALVVDFREIFSLPHDYLADHATRLGPRWRLRPRFSNTSRKPSRASSCAWASPRRFPSSVERRHIDRRAHCPDPWHGP